MSTKILVPKTLTNIKAVDFAESIMKLPPDEKYIFDFNELGWMDPFGMLFTSEALRCFMRKKSAEYEAKFSAKNFEKHGYYGHMGFFQCFGLNFGNKPGDAAGSEKYLPITELRIDDLRKEAMESFEPIGETVTKHAASIATVLTREDSGKLFESLRYSIREVLRNVAEHSESKVVRYCAQYWPTKNKVQIAIIDNGIGIASSLANNPYLDIPSDADALKLATMPGISGKMFKGVKIRQKDGWHNSGYGLYMLYRMCRQAGSLLMTSNNATLEVISNTHKATSRSSLPGTSLRIQFNTEKLDDLRSQLQRYAKDGHEQALKIKGAQTITASAASLMLHSEEE